MRRASPFRPVFDARVSPTLGYVASTLRWLWRSFPGSVLLLCLSASPRPRLHPRALESLGHSLGASADRRTASELQHAVSQASRCRSDLAPRLAHTLRTALLPSCRRSQRPGILLRAAACSCCSAALAGVSRATLAPLRSFLACCPLSQTSCRMPDVESLTYLAKIWSTEDHHRGSWSDLQFRSLIVGSRAKARRQPPQPAEHSPCCHCSPAAPALRCSELARGLRDRLGVCSLRLLFGFDHGYHDIRLSWYWALIYRGLCSVISTDS